MEHYFSKIHGWFTFHGLYYDMVKKFGDGSHFVEVGSWMGCSAVYMGVEIVNSKKKIKFDCIDNWEAAEKMFNVKEKDKFQGKKTIYEHFLHNIKPLKHIIGHHKIDSVEGAKLYPDKSLDFVYIDASHEYEDVLADIIAWYPKLKPHGVMAGHDYIAYAGVAKAVHEFFPKNKITIDDISWVVYK